MEHFLTHSSNTLQEKGGGQELELKDQPKKRKKGKEEDATMKSNSRTRRGNDSPFAVSSRTKSNRQPVNAQDSSPISSSTALPTSKRASRSTTNGQATYHRPGSVRRLPMPGTYVQHDDEDETEPGNGSDHEINGQPFSDWTSPRPQLKRAGEASTSSKPTSTDSSRKSKSRRVSDESNRSRSQSIRELRRPGEDDPVFSVDDDSDKDAAKQPVRASPRHNGKAAASSRTSGSRSPVKQQRHKSERPPRLSTSPTKPDCLEGEDHSDAIDEFPPSLEEPATRKAKAPVPVPLLGSRREPAPPERSQSRRSRMQDKHGIVPQAELAPPRAGKKSSAIPSSFPSAHLLCQLSVCFASFSTGVCLIQADRMGFVPFTQIIELFPDNNKQSCAFPPTSISSLTSCSESDSDSLLCQLRLRLNSSEREAFSNTFLGGSDCDADFQLNIFMRPGREGPCVLESLRAAVKPNHLLAPHAVHRLKEYLFREIQNDSPRSERRDPARKASQAAIARQETASNRSKVTATRSRGKPDNDDPFQPKLDFGSSKISSVFPGGRRSLRLGTQASGADDGGDIQIQRPPRLDKNDLLFPYPLKGRTDLLITKDALYRLEDGDFLNDVFIEFGLKETIRENLAMRSAVHLFNSFFYERLSKKDASKQKASDEEWSAYDAVKKWTKSADVFSKKFVIIPINESLHWFLAVIYNPAGCLTDLAVALPPLPRSSSAPGGSTATSPPDCEPDSKDPIDCISEDDDVAKVENGVQKLDIERSSPTPQPIVSATLTTFADQWKDPQPLEDPADDVQPRSKATREDYDIAGSSDKTYIMTFDSLGYPHKAVTNNLKRWLLFEARDKRGQGVDSDSIFAIDAKVPQQQNFSDCGVFLVHYVRTLLANPEEVLRFVGKAPFKGPKSEEWVKELNNVWNREDKSDLRHHWVNTINEYTATYRSLQDGNGADATVDSAAAPPESQASVQMSSQPPPDMAAAVDYPAPDCNAILSPSPQPEQHDEDHFKPSRYRQSAPGSHHAYHKSPPQPLVSDDSEPEEFEEPYGGMMVDDDFADNRHTRGTSPVDDPGSSALADIVLSGDATPALVQAASIRGPCPDDPTDDLDGSDSDDQWPSVSDHSPAGDLGDAAGSDTTPRLPSGSGKVSTFRVVGAGKATRNQRSPTPPKGGDVPSSGTRQRIDLSTGSSSAKQSRFLSHVAPPSSSALPISPDVNRALLLDDEKRESAERTLRNASPSYGRGKNSTSSSSLGVPSRPQASAAESPRSSRGHRDKNVGARDMDDSTGPVTSPSRITRAQAKDRVDLEDVEQQPVPPPRRKSTTTARKSLNSSAPSPHALGADTASGPGKRPRAASAVGTDPKRRKETARDRQVWGPLMRQRKANDNDGQGQEQTPIHIDDSD